MITKSIIIFIVGLINIILGIFILKKNAKSPSNIWYFFLCLTGGGWAVVKAFQISVLDLNLQYGLLVKLIYIMGIFAPFSYLMLSYYFPYKLKDYSKKNIGLVFIIPIIMASLVAMGLLVFHESYIINGLLYREVIFDQYLIFFVYFYLYITLGFILLLVKYFKETGIYKKQIQYLIIATIGTFMTTGVCSMILILFNNFAYDWFGAILLIIHFTVSGYLIFYKPTKNI